MVYPGKHWTFEENNELGPDLEWMLQGTQASAAIILETLVRDYYSRLLRLANAILDDPDLSQRVAQMTIVDIVRNRHRYTRDIGIKILIYQQVVKGCRSIDRNNKKPGQISVTLRSGTEKSPPEQKMFFGTTDAEVWREVDRLEENSRISLFLKIIGELSTNEIGSVMRLKEAKVTEQLGTSFGVLYDAIQPMMLDRQKFEAIFSTTISHHWLELEMSENDLQGIIDSVLNRYNRIQRKRKTISTFQQAGLIGFALAVIALTGWLTRRSASRGLPSPLSPQVVVVTQLVQVPVYTTPTPRPAVQGAPLTVDSPIDEVLTRLVSSRSRWKSLWWDAIIYQHGPPGYVGFPVARREQVWIRKPTDSLLLSGPASGGVDDGWLVTLGNVYPLNGSYEFSEDNFPQALWPDHAIDPFRINSYLILQPPVWAISGKEMRVSGSTKMYGNQTLIVDMFSENGLIQYRIWIDADKGTPLGLRFYAEDGLTVTGEIFLDRISYDADFPESLFDPNFQESAFIKEYKANQPAGSWKNASLYPRSSGHEPLPRIDPPAGYDPSGHDLKLQWYLAPPAHSTGIDTIPVEIFSGEYYLGQTMVGDPWNATCERSPDGKYLAIVDESNVEQPDNSPKTSFRLSWVDITGDLSSHEPLPAGSSYQNVATFSPDSRSLAFWGCGVKETNCGVYILDLQSRKLRKILAGSYVYFLAWRPDGEELMLLKADNQVLAVRPDTGEITYRSHMASSLTLPPGAPMRSWNITISLSQHGLYDCRFPNSQ